MSISKEEFIKAIEDVKTVSKYHEGLNNFFRKNNVQGYIFQPDCCDTVLRLLHNVFSEGDKDKWIEYFCFDLNYGKKWEQGSIRDKYGKEIVLQTSEDLYKLISK